MAVALFAVSHLFAPLHALFAGSSADTRRFVRTRGQRARHGETQSAPALAAERAQGQRCAERAKPGALPPALRSNRPLRVVRVVEPTRGAMGAGRMVISGRLADVCAELDRLAALEAVGR